MEITAGTHPKKTNKKNNLRPNRWDEDKGKMQSSGEREQDQVRAQQWSVTWELLRGDTQQLRLHFVTFETDKDSKRKQSREEILKQVNLVHFFLTVLLTLTGIPQSKAAGRPYELVYSDAFKTQKKVVPFT